MLVINTIKMRITPAVFHLYGCFVHNYVAYCKSKRFLSLIRSLVEAAVFEIDTRIGISDTGVDNIALMPVLRPLPWR